MRRRCHGIGPPGVQLREVATAAQQRFFFVPSRTGSQNVTIVSCGDAVGAFARKVVFSAVLRRFFARAAV
jgi:hypothetical protein